MDENNSIQLFEDRKIRTAWGEEKEEWYFSVVDVVAVLSDSANPTEYLKKMRKRDEQLASYLGTNCPQVEMTGSTGKKRKVLAANTEQILRIIQSIPSPKAEPFRLWLAAVGRERIEETIDPEQAIDRALETYQKKGYDADWIHQRILSIRVRNELTAEWQARGVEQGQEYAILTDECALPGFVDSKNEEKTERNAGYLVVSHSGGGMLRQGTRKGIRRTPANRGMRAHRIVKSLDISEDVCHGLCP